METSQLHEEFHGDQRLYRLLEASHSINGRLLRFVPLLSAFLVGVLSNALSNPSVEGFADFLRSVYDPRVRPVAWVNIAVTAVLIISPIAYVVVRRFVGTSSQALRLTARFQSRISPGIREFSRGRIAWGEQVVLQSSPKVNEGWRLDDVRIIKDPTAYRFTSRDMGQAFNRWLKSTSDDVAQLRPKYRLMENPISFSDAPTVTIRVQESTWPQALFINRNFALIESQRMRLIRQTIGGVIEYPHIFCMHVTVATSDGWLLLTERSHKVAYDPKTWSVSLEEQLSETDFKGDGSEVAGQWLCRALVEELGLSAIEATKGSARVLAVFLETDKLNTGLAVLVTLGLSKQELNAIIDTRPREDYEFQDWTFIRWDDLAAETINPSRRYHPSSGLRMLLSGIVHYGVFGFSERLDTETRRPRSRRR